MFFVRLYKRYQQFRPFTDEEAWMLFKLAAICEAITWTLLITGIAAKHLPVWWNQIPVGVAGMIHGVMLLIYLTAVLVLAPSMGWSWQRIVFALLFGNPPYGSIIFEKWVERDRRWTDLRQIYRTLLYRTALST